MVVWLEVFQDRGNGRMKSLKGWKKRKEAKNRQGSVEETRQRHADRLRGPAGKDSIELRQSSLTAHLQAPFESTGVPCSPKSLS